MHLLVRTEEVYPLLCFHFVNRWIEVIVAVNFVVTHAAFIAWALLGTEGPHSEISFYIGSLHFVHWRLFLMICTLPAFVSSVSLLFLPESPAYLFQVNHFILHT